MEPSVRGGVRGQNQGSEMKSGIRATAPSRSQRPDFRVRCQEPEPKLKPGLYGVKQGRSRPGNKQAQELLQLWANALHRCHTTGAAGLKSWSAESPRQSGRVANQAVCCRPTELIRVLRDWICCGPRFLTLTVLQSFSIHSPSFHFSAHCILRTPSCTCKLLVTSM